MRSACFDSIVLGISMMIQYGIGFVSAHRVIPGIIVGVVLSLVVPTVSFFYHHHNEKEPIYHKNHLYTIHEDCLHI